MRIANPIYDVVFKYLMQNNEIATLILSTILEEEILSLNLLPQETAMESVRGAGPESVLPAMVCVPSFTVPIPGRKRTRARWYPCAVF